MNIVEFPGLGLSIPVDPVAIHLGPISIYWYGIIIAVSFILAVFLAMRYSRKVGIEEESVIDLVLFAAPVAIICARIYYVILSWDKYKNDPAEIYKIWHGGLAIYGAVIGALVVAYFFAKSKKIAPFKLFDFGVPYLVLAQAIGRWGNFVNQEAFGVNTSLPWGMTGDKIKAMLADLQMQGMNVNPQLPVHPTFLYESLWDLAVFFTLVWYRKRKKLDGEVFFLYMILYGIGRFGIESLRTDSLMLGNLRASMGLAFLFAVGFAIAFFVRRKKAGDAAVESAEAGSSEYGAILKHIKEEDTQAETGEPDPADQGEDSGENGVSTENDAKEEK